MRRKSLIKQKIWGWVGLFTLCTSFIGASSLISLNLIKNIKNRSNNFSKRKNIPQYSTLSSLSTNYGTSTYSINNVVDEASNSWSYQNWEGYDSASMQFFAGLTILNFDNNWSSGINNYDIVKNNFPLIQLSPYFLSKFSDNSWKNELPLNLNWTQLGNTIIDNDFQVFNGGFYQYISSYQQPTNVFISNNSTQTISQLVQQGSINSLSNNIGTWSSALSHASPWTLQITGLPSLSLVNDYLSFALNINSTNAWVNTVEGSMNVQTPSMTIKFYIDGVTFPFSMNQIKNNISSTISPIALNHYYFENYWDTTILNNIKADIESCIPTYMNNCFTINSSVTNYGTSGTISTTVSYVNYNNQTVTWNFTTNVTMPSQPSNEGIYNYCSTLFSQPILLESNTSNVWNSNKIFGYTLSEWEQQPEAKLLPTTGGFIEDYDTTTNSVPENDIKYYNGTNTDSSTDVTWVSNYEILNNYLSFLKSQVQNYINNESGGVNGTPFASNPLTYTFSFETINNTNYIVTNITFSNNGWNDNSNIVKDSIPSPWTFYTPVTLSNSTYYFSQSVNLRLSIIAMKMPVAGNTFSVESDNGFLIPNSSGVSENNNGVINNGTWLYYSNSTLKFTGSLDESESLTINGEDVQVLNNQFTYNLSAPTLNNSSSSTSSSSASNNSSSSNSSTSSDKNEYVINIYKSGTLIFTETIIVEQGVPDVQYKWYAWDPSQKSWQEKYITPTLSNGKTNPDYNSNINPTTGSVSQILWINQAPLNNDPVYYDPYNQYNQPYETNDEVPSSDIGYIAEGLVFNKGVTISFNTNDAQVQREGLKIENNQFVYDSNPTGQLAFANIGAPTDISPNSTNTSDYYSYSGLWQYTVNSLYDGKNYFPNNTGIYSFYLVDVINSDVQSNFNYFTNIVDTSDVVSFWSTWHGSHLLYYLEKTQNMTQTEVESLNYNNVLFWWNIYCETGITQQYLSNQPYDLASSKLTNIYMNTSNEETIKSIITSQIEATLDNANLIDGIDYEINLTQAQISTLANYMNTSTKSASVVITVTSLDTNVCTGTLNITVTDSANIINLANVTFGTLEFGIVGDTQTDISDIQNTIINQVTQSINNYAKSIGSDETLVYGKDFTIDWSNLSSIEFANLNGNITVKTAYFEISSINSNLCYGTNQILVNNNLNYSGSNGSNSGTFNLSYININNLYMNVASSNLNDAEAIISNYIFDDIAYAFYTYFKNENLTDSIYAKELDFNWNSTIYKNNDIIYPSNYGQYWTIQNYNSVLSTLASDLENKNFDNSIVLYIVPTVQGSSNLYGSIPLYVSNAYDNPYDPSIPNYTFPPQTVPDQINNNSGNSTTNSSSSSSASKNKNSLPSWEIPVIVISSLLLLLLIWTIIYRLKHKKPI